MGNIIDISYYNTTQPSNIPYSPTILFFMESQSGEYNTYRYIDSLDSLLFYYNTNLGVYKSFDLAYKLVEIGYKLLVCNIRQVVNYTTCRVFENSSSAGFKIGKDYSLTGSFPNSPLNNSVKIIFDSEDGSVKRGDYLLFPLQGRFRALFWFGDTTDTQPPIIINHWYYNYKIDTVLGINGLIKVFNDKVGIKAEKVGSNEIRIISFKGVKITDNITFGEMELDPIGEMDYICYRFNDKKVMDFTSLLPSEVENVLQVETDSENLTISLVVDNKILRQESYPIDLDPNSSYYLESNINTNSELVRIQLYSTSLPTGKWTLNRVEVPSQTLEFDDLLSPVLSSLEDIPTFDILTNLFISEESYTLLREKLPFGEGDRLYLTLRTLVSPLSSPEDFVIYIKDGDIETINPIYLFLYLTINKLEQYRLDSDSYSYTPTPKSFIINSYYNEFGNILMTDFLGYTQSKKLHTAYLILNIVAKYNLLFTGWDQVYTQEDLLKVIDTSGDTYREFVDNDLVTLSVTSFIVTGRKATISLIFFIEDRGIIKELILNISKDITLRN